LVAVDFLPDDALQSALSRLASQLAAGVLKPLPLASHSLGSVQVALRQMSQARHVGKIVVRVPGPELQRSAPVACGSVLVTGGLGTLGSLAAGWLATATRLHVHATGRSGRFAGSSNAGLQGLIVRGCSGLVSLSSADPSNTEDAGSLASFAPAAAIVHAAGVLSDATLHNQTLKSLRTVFAPKVAAVQQLEVATAAQPTARQVLYSSVASLLGSPGQANYGAANAMLDSMAGATQARGLAMASVQWGAWAGAGMAAGDKSTRARVERTGLGLVEVPVGLAALEGLLCAALAPAVLAAVPFSWDRFLKQLGGGAVPAMFAEFGTGPVPGSAEILPGSAAASASVPAASVAVRREAVQAQVVEAVVAVLGSSVGAEEPLMAAGLDSLGAVELRNSLEAALGAELPSTLVFDYPTIGALATFVTSRLAPRAEAANAAVMVSVPQQAPVAADGLRGVWLSSLVSRSAGDALLSSAASDQPRRIPLDRWDVEAQAELCGGLPVQFGVFLDGAALFDSAALGVSDTEAALMDPQQRLLLETATEAVLSRPQEAADEALRAGWGVFVVSVTGVTGVTGLVVLICCI
jgi:acyl carrier protein